MHSCIYKGHLGHQRFVPVAHRFRYALHMFYLDLDELPSLLDGRHFIYRAKFSPASFCRGDHLGDPRQPLGEAVGDLVEARTGQRPAGPIRLLTGLRNFGYAFSPLNLYYCYNAGGQRVETVVAEVSNTPWLQRHCYVLWHGNRKEASAPTADPPMADPLGRGRAAVPPAPVPGPALRFRHPKSFHVSPFMGMDVDYEWQLGEPGESLRVVIENWRGGERIFYATLALDRRPLDRWQVLCTLLRHPWMSGRITAGIYFQAFRLWGKRCPYYPHPGDGGRRRAGPKPNP
jgi:DUF1365 family protein